MPASGAGDAVLVVTARVVRSQLERGQLLGDVHRLVDLLPVGALALRVGRLAAALAAQHLQRRLDPLAGGQLACHVLGHARVRQRLLLLRVSRQQHDCHAGVLFLDGGARLNHSLGVQAHIHLGDDKGSAGSGGLVSGRDSQRGGLLLVLGSLSLLEVHHLGVQGGHNGAQLCLLREGDDAGVHLHLERIDRRLQLLSRQGVSSLERGLQAGALRNGGVGGTGGVGHNAADALGDALLGDDGKGLGLGGVGEVCAAAELDRVRCVGLLLGLREQLLHGHAHAEDADGIRVVLAEDGAQAVDLEGVVLGHILGIHAQRGGNLLAHDGLALA
mmetsp:Transcript_11487/g.29022  ORF Transcript_11487/g.29022 Transcript_11487/m.29022 type:complete len:330 (+) Transcript_11487:93-1082(+)